MAQMSGEIGDVVFSFLPPTQFFAQRGTNWQQLTGQALAGTALGAILVAAGVSLADAPDMRDKFVRGAGGTNGASVGVVQENATAVNGLSSPPHTHIFDYGANFAPDNGNLTTQGDGGATTNVVTGTNATAITLEGDVETRPINVALYCYGRLN